MSPPCFTHSVFFMQSTNDWAISLQDLPIPYLRFSEETKQCKRRTMTWRASLEKLWTNFLLVTKEEVFKSNYKLRSQCNSRLMVWVWHTHFVARSLRRNFQTGKSSSTFLAWSFSAFFVLPHHFINVILNSSPLTSLLRILLLDFHHVVNQFFFFIIIAPKSTHKADKARLAAATNRNKKGDNLVASYDDECAIQNSCILLSHQHCKMHWTTFKYGSRMVPAG